LDSTKIAILIVLQTGMQPQEIQGLKWSNLVTDGKYKVFRIIIHGMKKKNSLTFI